LRRRFRETGLVNIQGAIRMTLQATTERMVQALYSELQAQNPLARLRAILLLGRIGGSQVVELLSPLLDDEDAGVRCAVVEVLSKAGADAELLKASQDADEAVRRRVNEAYWSKRLNEAPRRRTASFAACFAAMAHF
jgi:HEAT repeat protein